MGTVPEDLSEEAIEQFLQDLKNTLGVRNASNFAHNLVGDFGTTTGLSWPGKNPQESIQFAGISAGFDFINTMKIEVKEGRAYNRDYGTETSKIIFNETAVQAMGLENPIGQTVNLWGENREIIGVLSDFHFDALYDEIQPLFMKLDLNSFASNFMVRLNTENQAGTLARIKKAYQQAFSNVVPFEYSYLDDNYQTLYARETQLGTLSKYFAGLAIIISCLGLFGLASFTAERRKREIGIRKTLGQSKQQITVLLSRDFMKLVGVAIAIGMIISFILAQNWLSNFAYKAELTFGLFAIAGLITLIIALFTVSTQALRAANKNPIDALKVE